MIRLSRNRASDVSRSAGHNVKHVAIMVLRRARRTPELLLLPPTLIAVGIILLPIGYTAWLSTRRADLSSADPWTSAGGQNYTDQLTDPTVHDALVRTLFFGSVTVALCLLAALIAALVIRERFLGRSLLLVIVLIPWAIPPAVNGIFWKYIFSPDFGLLNAVLFKVGFITQYQTWLIDSSTQALTFAAVGESWKFTPFIALILLVALESIPASIYRAAQIDGATRLRRFWHITLPGIRRTLLLAGIFQALFTLQTFDLIFVLTRGGPGFDTTTLNFLVYREAFEFLSLGRASALGILLAAFALILAGFAALAVRAGRGTRPPAVATA